LDRIHQVNVVQQTNLRTLFVSAISTLLLLGSIADAATSLHPARGRNGVVATSSAIASEVGVQILRNGGNAVDAAIATAFAMAVTWPSAGNIGGGGFLIYPGVEG
jgi:gamma-glutamyltranspeptidase/glutathione hydrolase